VKFSVRTSILINSRECSLLGVNEEVNIPPRGLISPLGARGEVKKLIMALCVVHKAINTTSFKKKKIFSPRYYGNTVPTSQLQRQRCSCKFSGHRPAPGANPMTCEFTTTTPALKSARAFS
jgi:hypothetical protein